MGAYRRTWKPVVPWIRLEIGFYSLFCVFPRGRDVTQVQVDFPGKEKCLLGQFYVLGPHAVCPSIPLLGIYPKEYKTRSSVVTYTPMFISALFTVAKLWKQPRCLITDEWIMKL
jgi:hypothetical protein